MSVYSNNTWGMNTVWTCLSLPSWESICYTRISH